MTTEQAKQKLEVEAFEAKQEEILKDLPEEFHSPLRLLAWEEGHSNGYNEVLNYLGDYVFTLKPAIAAFQKRIQGA